MLLMPQAQLAQDVNNILSKIRRGCALARTDSQANPPLNMMVDLPEGIDFEITVVRGYQANSYPRLTIISDQNSQTENQNISSSENESGLDLGNKSITGGGQEQESLVENENETRNVVNNQQENKTTQTSRTIQNNNTRTRTGTEIRVVGKSATISELQLGKQIGISSTGKSESGTGVKTGTKTSADSGSGAKSSSASGLTSKTITQSQTASNTSSRTQSGTQSASANSSNTATGTSTGSGTGSDGVSSTTQANTTGTGTGTKTGTRTTTSSGSGSSTSQRSGSGTSTSSRSGTRTQSGSRVTTGSDSLSRSQAGTMLGGRASTNGREYRSFEDESGTASSNSEVISQMDQVSGSVSCGGT